MGFACSSGMAAIQLVLSLFKPGDELVVPDDLYGGTYRLLISSKILIILSLFIQNLNRLNRWKH